MVSIPHAARRIKDDLATLISPTLIQSLCAQLGYVWRDGPLNPVTTVQLFIMQVLHGNTAINHLRHLANMAISASAYCQARRRLPLELFERLTASVTATLVDASAEARRWRGHRVWHIDGSGFSMPDTPALRTHFGQPGGQKPGCGFPVAKLMVLCDAATGLIARTLALPLRTHDLAHAPALHEALGAGDVLVGDRAFCSYVHLTLVFQRNLHAVFRLHQRTIVSFKRGRTHAGQHPKSHRRGLPTSKWLRRLGPCDQLVTWFKPKQRPRWCDADTFDQMPDTLTLRELRYRVGRPGFRTRIVTLVTTLTDAERYPKHELAEQYYQRWRIETRLRELKITMKMDALRCKSVDGVLKELAVFALAYNLVRFVCLRAAQRRNVEPDRISFIDALRWLRDAKDAPAWPTLIINPDRSDRIEPRVLKRRKKQYPLMNRPRDTLRQAMIRKSVAA